MVMAIKYQILMCRNPRHLVMITLNHIDAMMDFTTNTAVKQNIHTAYELLIQVNINQLKKMLHQNTRKIVTIQMVLFLLFILIDLLQAAPEPVTSHSLQYSKLFSR